MVQVTIEVISKLLEGKVQDPVFVKNELLPLYVREVLADAQKIQNVVIPALDEAIQAKVEASEYDQEFLKLSSAIVELTEGNAVATNDAIIVEEPQVIA